MAQNDLQDIAKALESAINEGGYAFQHKVIHLARECAHKTGWKVDLGEFPVAGPGGDTSIDFMLRQDRDEHHFRIIAECKRPNPKFKTWCFAKAPFVHTKYQHGVYLYLEHVRFGKGDCFAQGIQYRYETKAPFCHLSWEIKGNEKGDSGGKGRGAITDSLTQVLRGMNGFINHLYPRRYQAPAQQFYLVPVIFTTARLFVTSVDLRDTELTSGNVDVPKDSLSEHPWVYYDALVGPGLKPSRWEPGGAELVDVIDQEFIRTVPIVTANKIEEFLYDFLRDQ
ncbi:MAG: hypothetical protein IID34_01125 [Planctomycetes bacterium]|nr:hypothetical protein [Planctomycetota bacterium]